MDNKTYVFEGKTSTEAIEKGLKELKVSKNKVDIKILEQEDKRSFFSILTPRIVKVEMKLKENIQEEKLENSLRPQTLEEYIGQTKVKENMKIYIEAAKKNQ